MTKNKKSWLTRLEEADRKAQRRLELKNDQVTELAFEHYKQHPRKQTAKERMRASIRRICGFFIAQIFLLGWLVYVSSGAIDGWDALATTYVLVVTLFMLSIAMIAVCVYTLSKHPKAYSLYFMLVFNCTLAFYLLSKLG